MYDRRLAKIDSLYKKYTKSIESLHSRGFSVRAVISDNSLMGVIKIIWLMKEGKKIYLFSDSVHLLKNIRNNLLNKKKILFPPFNFDRFFFGFFYLCIFIQRR